MPRRVHFPVMAVFVSCALVACATRGSPTPAPVLDALGDTRTRPADGMVMVYVPQGEFRMGSTWEEAKSAQQLCRQYSGGDAVAVCQASAFANEQPAHTVALDSFWLDRTEVTNSQYGLCVGAGACTPPAESGSYSRATYFADPAFDDYPVIWVDPQQAADYCAWAGGRLPTEAEWEYAARGPESRLFPWGDGFDGRRLNYCDAGCATGVRDETLVDGFADTAPVGSFRTGVSWCGALDMAGNVREWVADWYGYYTAQSQVNPTGPAVGEERIPKGGCWLDKPDDVRSANRGANAPDYVRHKVGFRCACGGS